MEAAAACLVGYGRGGGASRVVPARAGEIKNFTGIDDPYEAPSAPEIHLHTDQQTLEEEVAQIIDVLKARGLISAT